MVEAKEKIKVFTLCIGTKFICIYYVIESIFTITIETITIIYYQNYQFRNPFITEINLNL